MLQKNNIRMLPWHARSPDLNPSNMFGANYLKCEVLNLPQPVNLTNVVV